MKDYYEILGVPGSARLEDIKRAFRRLAFQHHPDTNPGTEKEAEAKFKEINEAYGVLSDDVKRRQYDLARNGQFAGAGYDSGYGGFPYSQQDIFRDIFTNPATFAEMNRMFRQAGLRFDQDFLNRLFFSGSGYIFQFSFSPSGVRRSTYQFGDETSGTAPPQIPAVPHRPGLLERFFTMIVVKLAGFVLRKAFGLSEPARDNGDLHSELSLTRAEVADGGEQEIAYKRGRQTRKLLVKIPAGVKAGTRIRLKGMGLARKGRTGDLYLEVKVRD